MSATIKLAIGSIVVGVIVLAIKTLAWWLTGSVALFSNALESTVNVATAIAALIAIRIAARGHRTPGGLQRFVSTHFATCNCFVPLWRRRSAQTRKYHRHEAFGIWHEAAAMAA
jgi:hypothetical protein